jgi:hypothetical protein
MFTIQSVTMPATSAADTPSKSQVAGGGEVLTIKKRHVFQGTDLANTKQLGKLISNIMQKAYEDLSCDTPQSVASSQQRIPQRKASALRVQTQATPRQFQPRQMRSADISLRPSDNEDDFSETAENEEESNKENESSDSSCGRKLKLTRTPDWDSRLRLKKSLSLEQRRTCSQLQIPGSVKTSKPTVVKKDT